MAWFALAALLCLVAGCRGSRDAEPATPPPTPVSTPALTPTPTLSPALVATALAPQTVTPAPIISREVVTTTLVAHAPPGTSSEVAMAADGRTLAFSSAADDLAPGNDNGHNVNGYDDIFVYDTGSGALTQLSLAADGAPGNRWSRGPAISADGRYVAFYSWASNLVPDDTNAVQDLFVVDRQRGLTSRLSVSAAGAQANDRSGDSEPGTRPAISADGRFVAYHAAASNLVADDTNRATDVFVYDRFANTTARISVNSAGEPGNGDSRHPALSGDGRYVAFQSAADNLGPLRGANHTQIYVHDRQTGATETVSFGADGLPGNGDSTHPALSADGRLVAFQSLASNLVAQDTNRVEDIFVYDRETGITTRVSLASTGTQGDGPSYAATLSPDGRYVGFASDAANLVAGDTNGVADAFVHDRAAGHTSRISVGVGGTWQGIQGNGPVQGAPALAAGGQLVAFVSAARNLITPDGAPGVGVYLHTRRNPPLYRVAGQVLNARQQPVAGVTVSAGPHQAQTGANGRFVLENLVGGTYTLSPAQNGLGFSPQRRIVSVLKDAADQDFVAYAEANAPLQFLDWPLAPETAPGAFLAALRDTDEGGAVDSWFDHDAPTYAKNGGVLLWDGRLRTRDPYNELLGCYERRCYDGHDGIDFPYRDPDPATAAAEPLLIHPAAPGTVVAVETNCAAGERRCNGGYGNEVVLDHGNGYFTRYAHLGEVHVAPGAQVTPAGVLGVMGNTGNSRGAHLHFGVQRDDGNGRWDGSAVDAPVDPFGWAGSEPDPWAGGPGGALSRWLWRHDPVVEKLIFGNQGATIGDVTGDVTVALPPAAFSGQARVELAPGIPAGPPAAGLRSLGRAFNLNVLEWLQPGGAVLPGAGDGMLARPLEVRVNLGDADTRHLDMENVRLQQWDAATQSWAALPATVAADGRQVYAASDRFGSFDVQAPLRCPADRFEPDDHYYTATTAPPGVAQTHLFDVADDADWLRLDVTAGAPLTLRFSDLAEGVRLRAEVYGQDGLTRLTATEVTEPGGELIWTPPDAGTYFARVTPLAGSALGCDAGYTVQIT